MANRLATAGDVSTYAGTVRQYYGTGVTMAEDDVILDSYTSGKLVNYNSNEWSGANPVIWIDPTTYHQDIQNFQLDTGWGWSASTRVEIRFLGRMEMAGVGSGNQSFAIDDMEDVAIFAELFGEAMGLLTEGDVELTPDLFGLVVRDTASSNTRELAFEGVTAITKSEVHGVCTMRGFAGDRVARNNNSSNLEIIRRNCMSVDAADGEGVYWGQTGDAATNPTISIDVENYLIVQRGQEAFQAQDLQTTTAGVTGKLKNITMVNPDVTWKAPFQNSQDYGWQLDFLQGDIDVEKFVLIGGKQAGLQIFSHDKTARGFNPTGTIRLKDGVISQVGDLAIRIHGSYDDGPELHIHNVYFTDFLDDYDEIGRTLQAFAIESATTPNSGSEKHIKGCTYQNGKTDFLNPSLTSDDKFFEFENTNDNGIPSPSFIADRFYLSEGNFPLLWEATYNYDIIDGTFNASSTDAIPYTTASVANPYTGSVVYAVMTGLGGTSQGDYYFFRCISNHDGDTASSDPETDVFVNGDGQTGTYWEVVQWDSNNVPSYHPSYSASNTPLSFVYYGNYRLAKTDNIYSNQEMGIVSDYQPSAYTSITWDVARDNGSGAVDETWILTVHGEFGEDFDSDNYAWVNVGDWVRANITPVGGSTATTSWIRIT